MEDKILIGLTGQLMKSIKDGDFWPASKENLTLNYRKVLGFFKKLED